MVQFARLMAKQKHHKSSLGPWIKYHPCWKWQQIMLDKNQLCWLMPDWCWWKSTNFVDSTFVTLWRLQHRYQVVGEHSVFISSKSRFISETHENPARRMLSGPPQHLAIKFHSLENIERAKLYYLVILHSHGKWSTLASNFRFLTAVECNHAKQTVCRYPAGCASTRPMW